jgi:hypothetical protein
LVSYWSLSGSEADIAASQPSLYDPRADKAFRAAPEWKLTVDEVLIAVDQALAEM